MNEDLTGIKTPVCAKLLHSVENESFRVGSACMNGTRKSIVV